MPSRLLISFVEKGRKCGWGLGGFDAIPNSGVTDYSVVSAVDKREIECGSACIAARSEQGISSQQGISSERGDPVEEGKRELVPQISIAECREQIVQTLCRYYEVIQISKVFETSKLKRCYLDVSESAADGRRSNRWSSDETVLCVMKVVVQRKAAKAKKRELRNQYIALGSMGSVGSTGKFLVYSTRHFNQEVASVLRTKRELEAHLSELERAYLPLRTVVNDGGA